MLREFKFPADTNVLFDLLPKAFQYPENPAWSIQQDEVQNMQDTMKMVHRMWPLLAVVGALSPAFSNAFRGFVWEEDNQAVGLVNTGTQGTGGRWFIGNVGVLPEYRRRGLARKLVEASVDLARRNKATMVWLDVIPGNVPAYKLYENLGFVHYDSAVELEQNGATTPAAIPLPQGYRLEQTTQFDWRPRFELAKRVTPNNVQVFEPVTEDQYKVPLLIRPIAMLFSRIGGSRRVPFWVYAPDGQVVGSISYSARTSPGGVNSLGAKLDPAHGHIAPALVSFLLNEIARQSPGRRIDTTSQQWQPAITDALCKVGFTVRNEMHRMGLKF